MSVSFVFRPSSTNTVYDGAQNLLGSDELLLNDGKAVTIDAGALVATPMGAADGLATLDSSGKVPNAQLTLGTANGIATLDGTGKVTSTQLSLGVANGIATLDGTGKVTSTQIPGNTRVQHVAIYAGTLSSTAYNWTTFTSAQKQISAPIDRAFGGGSWNASGHFVCGVKGMYSIHLTATYPHDATGFRGTRLSIYPVSSGVGAYSSYIMVPTWTTNGFSVVQSYACELDVGGYVIPQMCSSVASMASCQYILTMVMLYPL